MQLRRARRSVHRQLYGIGRGNLAEKRLECFLRTRFFFIGEFRRNKITLQNGIAAFLRKALHLVVERGNHHDGHTMRANLACLGADTRIKSFGEKTVSPLSM